MTIDKKNILSLMIIGFPIIDLLTAFFVRANYLISSGIVIRGIFLILLLWFFLKSEKIEKKLKKSITNYFIVIIIFFVFFLIINCGVSDFKLLFLEIKNFVKVFYFPVILLLLYSLKDELIFEKKMLFYMVGIYTLLLLFPLFLNIAHNSYGHFKSGVIGFFYSPNEIGAILGILFPYAVYMVIINKYFLASYIYISILIFTMLTIGTKVPLIAIVLTILSFTGIIFKHFIYPIFINKKFWKSLVRISLLILISFIMIINSTSLSNFNGHKERLEKDETKTEIEQTLNVIFSSRDLYLKNQLENLSDVKIGKYLFGLGSVDHKYNGRTVEMDYFDIVFNYGIIGFLLYFLPVILLLLKMFVIIIKKIEYYLNNELMIAHLTAIVLALGIALFAGRTFTAPSVSFFLAFIIIALINDLDNIQVENGFNNKKMGLEK